MRHAYLILAHNEFDVLKRLVNELDDARNDIYIHFDRKVKALPELSTRQAGLSVIEHRVDVRWGDWSVVEAEYALFAAAIEKGEYDYYHLLSGVDLTLKSQDYIDGFFEKNKGKEFIGYTLTSMTPELSRKVLLWHLFPKRFRDSSIFVRAMRALFLRLQISLGKRRNAGIDFKKGSQWVSVTEGMARYFIDHKEWAEKVFTHTFCSDEIVMQTLCWMSPYKENIYDVEDDGKGCMRAISWFDGEMRHWSLETDYPRLCKGPALFGRKFTSE